jgi:hypothetical protein
MFSKFSAFVSTTIRTEFIETSLNKRWASQKIFAASFTFAANFVSPLPLVCMFGTAEEFP